MNEFKWVLSRNYRENETTGINYILKGDEEIFKFYTVELPLFIVPLRLNSPRTNCIPGGKTYIVTKVFSPTKGKCFSIHDVEGRSNVLAHAGNFATGKKVDTEGCVLTGNGLKDINGDGSLDVINSKETLSRLLKIMPNEFELTIL